MVSNLSREQTTVEVTFDRRRLGLAPRLQAEDALTQVPIAMAGQTLTVDLASQEWRLVWLRGAQH